MQLLTPDLGLFCWNLLAFLILLFILGKFAWKPILKALSDRENGIADALASAEKVKQEMAKLQNDNEVLLASAREESASIIRDAKQSAEKMVADAKEKALKEYNRIVADAQAAIQQEKRATIAEVRSEVGLLVVDISEKILRRELTGKENQEKYIQQLADEARFN